MSEKYNCSKCGRFVGLIKADGSGPPFEESDCQEKAVENCPAAAFCAQFVPLPSKKYRCGTKGGGVDEDAGSYRSIAVRALEDGG